MLHDGPIACVLRPQVDKLAAQGIADGDVLDEAAVRTLIAESAHE